MGVIDSIRKLIFGASDEPRARVAGDTQQPFQRSRPGNTEGIAVQGVDAERSLVVQRAETLIRAFNDVLRQANESRDPAFRERKLQIAQELLAQLKSLVVNCPFLHLTQLQEVETSILAVESETRSLARTPQSEADVNDAPNTVRRDAAAAPSNIDKASTMFSEGGPRLSSRDKEVIATSMQSLLRIMNESIGIARNSHNRETQASRLGVARARLEEARRLGNRFAIAVDGLDGAEAEIARLEEAVRTGAPAQTAGAVPEIDVYAAFSSPARTLLKEATALKREKKYLAACDKLREAYAADGAETLMIEERLRLPMYLQLAGKNDEGWSELTRLAETYLGPFSQPIIAKQAKIFLRKENNEAALNPVRIMPRSESKPAEPSNAPLSSGITLGEMQDKPLSAWGNADVIKGLEFTATLQLRTPLRVLLRHGETHTDPGTPPPHIAQEPWEGFWFPITRTFKKLGLPNIPELPPGPQSSDVGEVRPKDYLPFLIAVRRIVEAPDTVERRIERLRSMPVDSGWQEFVAKHGGLEGIVDRFFPKFSYLPAPLDTPNRIAGASDETLLSIKGIGPARLKALREQCAAVTENRDSDRVDQVNR